MIEFHYNIKIFLLTIILWTLVACNVSEHKESALSANSKTEISSNTSASDELNHEAEITVRSEDFLKYKKIWNTEILKVFKEKSLEKLPDNVNETYRFIWIPSFESAIAIHVWQSKNKYFLVSKKVSGEGYEMKKLSHESTRNLTEEEWLEFVELIDKSSFWNMPSIDIDDEPETDGATYAIEGNKNNKFHEIHRATQTEGVREIGAYLLKLSGLKTGYDEYQNSVQP